MKHTEDQIINHAANCAQCLDATQGFNDTHGVMAIFKRETWLDMIDTLHDWE